MAQIRHLFVFALLFAAVDATAADRDAIAVIVHPQRAAELDADRLAQIYLRRSRFWPGGDLVVPLNLPATSPLRRHFVRRVLRQSEVQLANYWNRRYFDAVFPPSTLASTRAMKRYVAGDRNAIGYIPVNEVDTTVRVVFRIE